MYNQRYYIGFNIFGITNRQTSVTGMSKKVRSKIRITDIDMLLMVERERHQRCYVSCPTSVCKSQQQVYEVLWGKQRIFIFHALECEQSLWRGNATKFARRWF